MNAATLGTAKKKIPNRNLIILETTMREISNLNFPIFITIGSE